MTTTQNAAREGMHALLHRFIDAWNAHDVDAIMSCTTPHVVWESGLSDGELRGRTAARADVEAMFAAFPDLHFPMEDFHSYATDDPEVGLATWTMTGTMTGPLMGFAPTGRPFRVRGVCLYRVRDGRITDHRIRTDSLALLRQVGLFPRATDVSYRALAGAQRLVNQARGLLRL